MGYRNRFGVKYLCGGTNDQQTRAFSVLHEDENGMFSREQMNACLRRAGFVEHAYYYPMPDELFTQTVCSDDMPKRATLSDRVFAYDPFGSPLIAEEKPLYDDLLREGMLHTSANYYLAAFTKPPVPDARPKTVAFAALSTDRGKACSYTTIVYSDGTAQKSALHPEGVQNLSALSENLRAMAKRGIRVIPCELDGNTLRMPRIDEEPLPDAIGRLSKENIENLYRIFDDLREDIVKSSDIIEAENVDETLWGIAKEALGTVLKRGYIDMIPLNAFWSESGIRYYDQEFSVENCPVDYIMFRAIRYTWLHVAGLEELLPQSLMAERYGLKETWEAYAAYEQRFVEGNRNFGLYTQFYYWSYTDPGMVRANRAPLRSKREEQALIDRVHDVQLDLLKAFMRACDGLGLKYFAIHGTLLGAVRHRGFIPWDDDVDIAMPREDYEKLLAHRDEVFAHPYFLQSFENEQTCFYGGYAKLRNSKTAALEPRNRGKNCNQGIWIDILPVDRCPAEDAKRRKLQRRITALQQLLLAKLYPLRGNVLTEMGDTKRCLYHLLSRVLRRRWIYGWLHRAFTSVKGGRHLSILACYYRDWENRNVYRAQELESTVDMPFEDIVVPVPSGWRDILIRRYGADYARIPDISRRHMHKDVIFDTERSWKEWL